VPWLTVVEHRTGSLLADGDQARLVLPRTGSEPRCALGESEAHSRSSGIPEGILTSAEDSESNLRLERTVMQNVIEAEFPRASFHRGPLPSAAQDRKLLIIGNVSATNTRLSRAFGDRGLDAWILPASSAAGVLDCFDLALNRTDVAPTLDGPEAGFWTLAGSCGAVRSTGCSTHPSRCSLHTTSS